MPSLGSCSLRPSGWADRSLASAGWPERGVACHPPASAWPAPSGCVERRAHVKGPRGVWPPPSMAHRPHSPWSRVPPQNSSSSHGPSMVREETSPPDPALPPPDARRAPRIRADAWPAPGTLYWGRRPCPAEPAHAPPPAGHRGGQTGSWVLLYQDFLEKLGQAAAPPSLATCPLPPSRGLAHTPHPANTSVCSTPILPGGRAAGGSGAQPRHRQPHPGSREGPCSRRGGSCLGPTTPLGRKATSGRTSPEAKTV